MDLKHKKNMEFSFEGRTITIAKELSDLDLFVLDFVRPMDLLKINYVIVSGFVPIFFGRSRATEDVDVLIEKIGQNKFFELAKNAEAAGMWFLNTKNKKELYGMLASKLSIRMAPATKVIPNIELKFSQGEINNFSLQNPITIRTLKGSMLFSPIEVQIAFKFHLGSEKDIEDAIYLYELFGERLDIALLCSMALKLGVHGMMKKYGVELEKAV